MLFQENLIKENIRRKNKENMQRIFRRISQVFFQAQISFKT